MNNQEWVYPLQDAKTEQLISNLKQEGVRFSDAFLRLCIHKGYVTKVQIDEATDTRPQLYHDPHLLFNMEKAIERILGAIDLEERILVYGDYDADGITSTLIIVEALEALGAQVQFYLPNRLTDGYGPNLSRYQEFIDQGIQLIITCDNGIAGFEAIEFAMRKGVDVIVTDHHEVQAQLPKAFAIIHPAHPLGNYPFKDLSGAGVALKIAHALLGELSPDALELAAIGTIADLVSLKDENRTIVLSGLKLMSETVRPGLMLLLDDNNINFDKVDEDDIGFKIAPKLNAVGRLGDPSPGYHLLATEEEEQAKYFLSVVNEKNEQRKQLVHQIYLEAVQKIEQMPSLPPIILLADQNWLAGVLGIVASQLVEQYQRPVILFEHFVDTGQYKGSGRSISSVNLFDQLNLLQDLLLHFGGHSQAAGLTVEEKNWHAFNHQLVDNLALLFQTGDQIKEHLSIDLVLSYSEWQFSLLDEINLLKPFGTGNPKPLVALRNCIMIKSRFIGDRKQHVKFAIKDSGSSEFQDSVIEGIGFNNSYLIEPFLENQQANFAGFMTLNEWNGQKSLQLQLQRIYTHGTKIRDYRSSHFDARLFQNQHAIYLVRSQKVYAWVKERMKQTNRLFYYHEFDQSILPFNHLVLIEPPNKVSELETWLKAEDLDLVDLGVYIQHSVYLEGLPVRDDFARLYLLLKSQKKSKSADEWVSYLMSEMKMPLNKIKCLFSVFLELKFVIISNGRIQFNPIQAQSKQDVFKTTSFQKFQDLYDVEKLLNFQTLDQIKQYIDELRN